MNSQATNIFWNFVDLSMWKDTHDYRYAEKLYKKMPKNLQVIIKSDYDKLYNELERRFEKFVRDKLSDDSWSDLRSDIIGRGVNFYKSIDKQTIQQMISQEDYYENFGYAFV